MTTRASESICLRRIATRDSPSRAAGDSSRTGASHQAVPSGSGARRGERNGEDRESGRGRWRGKGQTHGVLHGGPPSLHGGEAVADAGALAVRGLLFCLGRAESMLHLSFGCFVEERAALLDIQSSLIRAHSLVALDSWGRMLEYLDLSYNHPCLLSLEGLVGLSKLRYLDLSDTTRGGGFPEFIERVASLEVLALNYNKMNEIPPAAVVKNLRNLRQLNMSWNSFDGNLPESLFSLPCLKIPDLSGNNFGGKIPISSSLGPIALEVLDLSINFINGTISVTVLKNIRNLNLRGNQFSGSLPVSLFTLPHLKFLDLSFNNLEGRFPINLTSEPVPLEVLKLDSNYMSGALPSERDLSSNLFRGPISITPSSNLSLSLKSLRFYQNNLTGRIYFIWLGNLRKLEEIDLSGNANLAVDVNIPGWTPPFQLKHLVLSGCDFEKNIIEEPHFLRTQSHLESIDIHMNHATGQLPANIGSLFPRLSILDVSSNNIVGHIPTSLCEIRHMSILHLSNNKLSGEVPACVFTNYSLLLTLKLSNNKLGGQLFGGVNSMYNNIKELYLDNNKFGGTIPQNLSGESLMFMDLHDNKLSGKLGIVSRITQGNMCAAPDPVAHEDVGETLSDPALYAVTTASFVLGFWAIVGFSFCHPYGRSVMLKL
ncbi:hypothetical protein D1007_11870 [Hordeum vulgare]|nr:hypothetical protein D1007_11870 [Hordeum vulgare]